MKRNCKKFCLLLVVLSIVFCLPTTNVSSESTQPATEIGSIDLRAFKEDVSSNIVAYLSEKAGGLDALREKEGFSGIYMDDDGLLHIGMTKESTEELKSLITNMPMQIIVTDAFQEYQAQLGEQDIAKSYLSMNKTILDANSYSCRIETMEYTYAYLRSLQSALTDCFADLGIHQTSILEDENCLEVTIEDQSSKERVITWLSQNTNDFDADAIRIVVQPNSMDYDAYVYNGTAVYSPKSTSIFGTEYETGTLGFCAQDRETGKYGIVTNAHLFTTNNNLYHINNNTATLYGTASKKQQTGTLDAAFIPYTNQSDWGSTYRILTGTGAIIRRIAIDTEYYVGRKIFKYGISTGRQYGYVRSVSTEKYDEANKITFTDIIKYEMKHAKGDSGGPIGIENTSEKFLLMGIHFASENEDDTCYGIKIENILQKFSLEEFALYRRGDSNLDQKINETDYTRILQYYIGKITLTSEEIKIVDVDFDGAVTTTDARIVLQRVSS